MRPAAKSQQKEFDMSQMLLTRTVTINAAFLQEIKEVNQELWRLLSDVRRLCRSPLSIYSSPRRFANLEIGRAHV